jgi:hypothetical protein
MSGDLVIDSDLVVDASAPHAVNTNCPDADGGVTGNCPSGSGNDEHICKCAGVVSSDCAFGTAKCSRLGGDKVHIIGKAKGSSGYALLAYDSSFPAGGTTRMAPYVKVVDVTSTPTVVDTWTVTLTGGSQAFWSTIGGASGDVAGWFYAWNNNDPCTTYIDATRSENDFLDDSTWTTYIAGGFPIVLGNRSGGMGDYIGAARVGRANGDPFGAMPMPVVTSASCIPCQGSQYSLPMKGMDLLK